VNALVPKLVGGDDVDDAAATAGAEFDSAGGEGEQGVVLAAANAGSRVEVGTALADDDLAGGNYLATEALDAKALCVGIATVASGARTLLMCHLFCLPLCLKERLKSQRIA
jgi:hypothetical protein